MSDRKAAVHAFFSSIRTYPAASLLRGFRCSRAVRCVLLLGSVLFGPFAFATPTLVQLSPTLYQTEHCLFVIDSSVTWSSPTTAYNEIYAYPFPKLNSAYDSLVAQFPGTYFSVCYIANTGDSHVPNYIDRTAKASGINETSAVGTPNTFATTDICRYNLPGGAVLKSVLAVFDHELGHAWGARAFYNTAPYPSLSNGHWLPNTTVDCQMSGTYSADGYASVNKLYGDPVSGFHWQKVDNLRSNDFETFSEQTLYLMGLSKIWPTTYVLNNVAYNSDTTASASSVDTLDHAAMVAAYGVRNPDFTSEQKRLKVGFVYLARDLAEVNTVYSNVEQSVDQFCNAEAWDPHNYRFQTPFLCDTKFRASVDGLLSDLNGNATPALSVTNPSVSSSDGTAVINFVAADPDGPMPAVSVVPSSTSCAIVGSTVQISGLPDGVHFFTLKAADAGGKKTFGHFVVEVQRPVTSTAISMQPVGQTVTAGAAASFTVTASGSPAVFTYQWFRQAAGESIWGSLSDGGVYTGATAASLSVTTATTLSGDKFLCLVSNATGTATSAAALLVVNETTPVLTGQPADRSVSAGTSVNFTVVAAGVPSTFGYFNYQWQRLPAAGGAWADLSNGGGYTGSTTAGLSVSSSLVMNGDQFRCLVSNTTGAVTSNVVSLLVGSVPTITTQPVSPVTLFAGQSASFSVVANGTAPLSYQWSRYGVPVLGATSATITFANVQAADAGAYTVSVSNALGYAGSNVGSLTVTAAVPTITSQPSSVAVSAGQAASFAVSASGTAPFTYQWKKNGTSVAGATSAVLSIASVLMIDAGSYTVVVLNGSGSVTSSAATLSVSKGSAIVTLGNLSIAYDGSVHSATVSTTPASLTVDFTYNGFPPTPSVAGSYAVVGTINDLNYQGAASGVLVIGKASAIVSLGSLTAIYNGTAHAVAATTSPASLAVSLTYAGSANAPTNAGTYAVVGVISDANFQGSATGSLVIGKSPASVTLGNLSATYNGATHAVTATTTPSALAVGLMYDGSATVPSSAGTYEVVGTVNDANYSGAASASLVISKAAATLILGGLSATYDGAMHVATATTTPAGLIVGFTYDGLASAPIDAGTHAVVGTMSDANYAGSSSGSLTIAKSVPVIAWAAPGGIVHGTALNGAQLNATSVVAGTFDYTPASGTILNAGTSFIDVTFTPSDSVNYANTSAQRTLIISASAAVPAILTQPLSQPAFTGSAVSFVVTASGAPAPTYQWQKGGIDIPGSVGSTLTFASVQLADAGSYALVATNAAGSVTSRFARLVVLVPQQNAITYATTRASTGVTAGGVVNFDYFVTNVGTKAWDAHHYLSIRDVNNTFVAFSSLIGILPGETTTANLNFPAPATPGTYTYYVQGLEDGVEFFSTQTTVVLTVLAPVTNAITYNTTTFPVSAAPGSNVIFTYNVTNTGTATWGANHILLLKNGSGTVISSTPLTILAPGASKTVNLSFTVPSTPGSYNYTVQASQTGVGDFGTHANLTLIALAPQPNAIVYNRVRYPDEVVPGAVMNLKYTLSNAGTQTWGAGHYVSLRDSASNYLAFLPLSGIGGGATKTVEFTLTAPTTPGTYTYYVQALEDGIEFFSTQDVVIVRVAALPLGNAISYNTSTIPVTASPGATVNFTANVTNRGTRPWGATHYLSFRDVDNTFLAFPTLNGVAPGASRTANLSFTAPTTPGIYTYTLQAFEDGVSFFEMADTVVLLVQ